MLALIIMALLGEMFSPCDSFSFGRRFGFRPEQPVGKRTIKANPHRIQDPFDVNIMDTDSDYKASDETNTAGDFRYKANWQVNTWLKMTTPVAFNYTRSILVSKK